MQITLVLTDDNENIVRSVLCDKDAIANDFDELIDHLTNDYYQDRTCCG